MDVSKTLVIPTYTLNKRLLEMAYKCALSHRDKVDQIIISEDGGQYSEELQKIADIYVYNGVNRGYTHNVNVGWKLSEGDFTIIANSDTYWISGDINNLCIKNKVSRPVITNLEIQGGIGSYFVVSKEVTEEYGILDERMRMFASDDEYYERIKHIFRVDDSVKIYHEKAQTMKVAGINIQEQQQKDAQIYQQIKK